VSVIDGSWEVHVKIGVPKETKGNENCVGLTADGVAELVAVVLKTRLEIRIRSMGYT
jgi:hypothetical protein